MHYYSWAIIPETGDVEEAVAAVLAPCYEGDRYPWPIASWDWYAIGGRWSEIPGTTLPERPEMLPCNIYAGEMGAIAKHDWNKDSDWETPDEIWEKQVEQFMSQFKRGRIIVVDTHS